MCALIAPGVYTIDDIGYNNTTEAAFEASLLEEATRGAKACPEQAITVEKLASVTNSDLP